MSVKPIYLFLQKIHVKIRAVKSIVDCKVKWELNDILSTFYAISSYFKQL